MDEEYRSLLILPMPSLVLAGPAVLVIGIVRAKLCTLSIAQGRFRPWAFCCDE